MWTLYNIPVLAVGVRHLRRAGQKKRKTLAVLEEKLPFVSIIVPVKDEARVVGRLLDALLRLDYPSEKREIVIVEDGSVDKTVEICREYVRRYPSQTKLVRQSISKGKPSALNYALKHVKGEIVGVFDADNVPEPEVLLRIAEYFADPSVGAVQGRACTINSDENMLTRIISNEEALRCKAYICGKDVLGLFIPLTGSCYFVRKSVIGEVGGWDNESLSEDTEMAAKLLERSFQTRFAPDVVSWQESPANLKQLFKQRLRWFRGTMEVALHYGRLIAKKPDMMGIDAEMTLIGPYMLPLCLVSYVITGYTLLSGVKLDFFYTLFLYGISVFSMISLLAIGLALVFTAKPRRTSNLLCLPLIYLYWSLQITVSVVALLQILLRTQRKWLKTVKSGVVIRCPSK